MHLPTSRDHHGVDGCCHGEEWVAMGGGQLDPVGELFEILDIWKKTLEIG